MWAGVLIRWPAGVRPGAGLVSNPSVMAVSAGRGLGGRTALVTGGGRGIGRAVAVALAVAGARVAVLARSGGEVGQIVALVSDRGGAALGLRADVSDPGQVSVALGRLTGGWGSVGVLVSNAATVAPLGPSVTLDPGEWAAVIAVNIVAVARLSFAVLPAMLQQGWGRIVNVSGGIAAHPGGMLRANAYATSKAALEAHTVNLAAELAGTGVTVNAFRPGGVDTAMQAWIRGQDPDRIGAALPDRFVRSCREGTLLSPGQSARSLLTRLPGEATGQIWDAAGPPSP
jgi:NAD(P)-dependent dehydrogenase (short-subunit alcohol dehydrogenase family)